MNRRDFLKCSLCCASIAMISGGAYLYKHKDNEPDMTFDTGDSSWLPHVEIHITEHCNLRCKYCSHFSSIAKEEYYDVQEFEKDMKRLAEITSQKIKHLALLGGEPLLHPNVTDFFEITRKYFPKNRIDILTNGLLLDSMDASFWKSMHKNRILLVPSLYPVEIDWDSIYKKIDKYHIMISKDTLPPDKLTMFEAKNYKIRKFDKFLLDLDGKQPIDKPCRGRAGCANFVHGKLYNCFKPSNIRHFNSYFNKNIEVDEKDYVDIYKAQSLEELVEFVFKPSPFCRFCKDPIEGVFDWETVPQHTIDEWV